MAANTQLGKYWMDENGQIVSFNATVVSCVHCDRKIPLGTLKTHLMQHLSRFHFKCSGCEFLSVDAMEARNHMLFCPMRSKGPIGAIHLDRCLRAELLATTEKRVLDGVRDYISAIRPRTDSTIPPIQRNQPFQASNPQNQYCESQQLNNSMPTHHSEVQHQLQNAPADHLNSAAQDLRPNSMNSSDSTLQCQDPPPYEASVNGLYQTNEMSRNQFIPSSSLHEAPRVVTENDQALNNLSIAGSMTNQADSCSVVSEESIPVLRIDELDMDGLNPEGDRSFSVQDILPNNQGAPTNTSEGAKNSGTSTTPTFEGPIYGTAISRNDSQNITQSSKGKELSSDQVRANRSSREPSRDTESQIGQQPSLRANITQLNSQPIPHLTADNSGQPNQNSARNNTSPVSRLEAIVESISRNRINSEVRPRVTGQPNSMLVQALSGDATSYSELRAGAGFHSTIQTSEPGTSHGMPASNLSSSQGDSATYSNREIGYNVPSLVCQSCSSGLLTLPQYLTHWFTNHADHPFEKALLPKLASLNASFCYDLNYWPGPKKKAQNQFERSIAETLHRDHSWMDLQFAAALATFFWFLASGVRKNARLLKNSKSNAGVKKRIEAPNMSNLTSPPQSAISPNQHAISQRCSMDRGPTLSQSHRTAGIPREPTNFSLDPPASQVDYNTILFGSDLDVGKFLTNMMGEQFYQGMRMQFRPELPGWDLRKYEQDYLGPAVAALVRFLLDHWVINHRRIPGAHLMTELQLQLIVKKIMMEMRDQLAELCFPYFQYKNELKDRLFDGNGAGAFAIAVSSELRRRRSLGTHTASPRFIGNGSPSPIASSFSFMEAQRRQNLPPNTVVTMSSAQPDGSSVCPCGCAMPQSNEFVNHHIAQPHVGPNRGILSQGVRFISTSTPHGNIAHSGSPVSSLPHSHSTGQLSHDFRNSIQNRQNNEHTQSMLPRPQIPAHPQHQFIIRNRNGRPQNAMIHQQSFVHPSLPAIPPNVEIAQPHSLSFHDSNITPPSFGQQVNQFIPHQHINVSHAPVSSESGQYSSRRINDELDTATLNEAGHSETIRFPEAPGRAAPVTSPIESPNREAPSSAGQTVVTETHQSQMQEPSARNLGIKVEVIQDDQSCTNYDCPTENRLETADAQSVPSEISRDTNVMGIGNDNTCEANDPGEIAASEFAERDRALDQLERPVAAKSRKRSDKNSNYDEMTICSKKRRREEVPIAEGVSFAALFSEIFEGETSCRNSTDVSIENCPRRPSPTVESEISGKDSRSQGNSISFQKLWNEIFGVTKKDAIITSQQDNADISQTIPGNSSITADCRDETEQHMTDRDSLDARLLKGVFSDCLFADNSVSAHSDRNTVASDLLFAPNSPQYDGTNAESVISQSSSNHSGLNGVINEITEIGAGLAELRDHSYSVPVQPNSFSFSNAGAESEYFAPIKILEEIEEDSLTAFKNAIYHYMNEKQFSAVRVITSAKFPKTALNFARLMWKKSCEIETQGLPTIKEKIIFRRSHHLPTNLRKKLSRKFHEKLRKEFSLHHWPERAKIYRLSKETKQSIPVILKWLSKEKFLRRMRICKRLKLPFHRRKDILGRAKLSEKARNMLQSYTEMKGRKTLLLRRLTLSHPNINHVTESKYGEDLLRYFTNSLQPAESACFTRSGALDVWESRENYNRHWLRKKKETEKVLSPSTTESVDMFWIDPETKKEYPVNDENSPGTIEVISPRRSNRIRHCSWKLSASLMSGSTQTAPRHYLTDRQQAMRVKSRKIQRDTLRVRLLRSKYQRLNSERRRLPRSESQHLPSIKTFPSAANLDRNLEEELNELDSSFDLVLMTTVSAGSSVKAFQIHKPKLRAAYYSARETSEGRKCFYVREKGDTPVTAEKCERLWRRRAKDSEISSTPVQCASLTPENDNVTLARENSSLKQSPSSSKDVSRSVSWELGNETPIFENVKLISHSSDPASFCVPNGRHYQEKLSEFHDFRLPLSVYANNVSKDPGEVSGGDVSGPNILSTFTDKGAAIAASAFTEKHSSNSTSSPEPSEQELEMALGHISSPHKDSKNKLQR